MRWRQLIGFSEINKTNYMFCLHGFHLETSPYFLSFSHCAKTTLCKHMAGTQPIFSIKHTAENSWIQLRNTCVLKQCYVCLPSQLPWSWLVQSEPVHHTLWTTAVFPSLSHWCLRLLILYKLSCWEFVNGFVWSLCVCLSLVRESDRQINCMGTTYWKPQRERNE